MQISGDSINDAANKARRDPYFNCGAWDENANNIDAGADKFTSTKVLPIGELRKERDIIFTR